MDDHCKAIKMAMSSITGDYDQLVLLCVFDMKTFKAQVGDAEIICSNGLKQGDKWTK